MLAQKKEICVPFESSICALLVFIVCALLSVFPDKVNDPMMAVQIEWMMEVPELYRQCYDKPFEVQPDASG